MNHADKNDFTFSRDIIEGNCEEFYSLYNDLRGDVYNMCERKKVHTREVAKNCRMIAEKMGLDEYDCDMAWVIGLLHDFARFGQAVMTHSFIDSDRFNHARLGARLLFTHQLINDIIPGYDKMCEADKLVMEKAVLHHGDYELPDDLSGRERLFGRIIRDADKLDIFRVVVTEGVLNLYGCSLEELLKTDISPAIEEAFYEHRPAEYPKRVTHADFLMAHIALFFGLEEEVSRQRAIEQGYLVRMMDIEFADPLVQKKYLGMKEQVKTRGRF